MKQNGFSFIEVLIALAIISFLLAGTAELLIRSSALKRRADINLKMTTLVSSKLESLKSLPYESTELQANSYSEIIEGPSQQTFRREWTIEDISADMKKIGVTVYPENHPEKTFWIGLLLSRDLGL